MAPTDPDLNLATQHILHAASTHDIPGLTALLLSHAITFSDHRAVDVQDPETGRTPLHVAIGGLLASKVVGKEAVAEQMVTLLLDEGAIWNQLDGAGETPGLGGEVEGEEDNDEGGIDEAQDVTSQRYLSSALSLSSDRLLDAQQNGVMMAWEGEIMRKSADAILSAPGLRVLNIGFGMGLIDGYVQGHANRPSEHHIVEAHVDVLGEMRAKGWVEKEGVTIHEGRWQDVLPGLVAGGILFDAIYFDTFAEDYAEFREFFEEQVIGLLGQRGRWSFFNGMGADRQISYDVYQKVVEMDLFEAGFDVDWVEIDVPELGEEWRV